MDGEGGGECEGEGGGECEGARVGFLDGDGAGSHGTLTKTPTFALTFPHLEGTAGECAEGKGGG